MANWKEKTTQKMSASQRAQCGLLDTFSQMR